MMELVNHSEPHSGYVALVGRPNVGKSTLMNRLIKTKLSITSRRPQTTRQQILGIDTFNNTQVIFVDTPGIHHATGKRNRAINHYMNQTALQALNQVDCLVFVIDRLNWQEEDELVLNKIRSFNGPIVLVINKIDWLKDKQQLLPWIDQLKQRIAFKAIFPVSAKNGHGIEELMSYLRTLMPINQHYFPPEQMTDRNERFLVAELIREKVMRQLGEEIPYQLSIEIEQFREEAQITHIHALLLVEKEGQKNILIGNKGERLKMIGQAARHDIEQLLNKHVMLKLWVKVRRGWGDDLRSLKSLGYD